jgi:hypothetical protein
MTAFQQEGLQFYFPLTISFNIRNSTSDPAIVSPFVYHGTDKHHCIHSNRRVTICKFARMSGNTTPGSVVRGAISDIKGNRQRKILSLQICKL